MRPLSYGVGAERSMNRSPPDHSGKAAGERCWITASLRNHARWASNFVLHDCVRRAREEPDHSQAPPDAHLPYRAGSASNFVLHELEQK